MWFDTMVFFSFIPGFLRLQSHISYFGIFFTTWIIFFTTRINFKIPWVRIPLPQVIYEVHTTEILASHSHKYVDPYCVIYFIYVVFIFVNVIFPFFLPGCILLIPKHVPHNYGLRYLVLFFSNHVFSLFTSSKWTEIWMLFNSITWFNERYFVTHYP